MMDLKTKLACYSRIVKKLLVLDKVKDETIESLNIFFILFLLGQNKVANKVHRLPGSALRVCVGLTETVSLVCVSETVSLRLTS